MECKLCKSTQVSITYDGQIRDGALGNYTHVPVKMWKCEDCGVIWHSPMQDSISYYEGNAYRVSLEGTSEEDDFYRLHDGESLDKLRYTGTSIYRGRVVADIGSGCGAFLDFVKGAAKEAIAVEPSRHYREVMDGKGLHTFAYAKEAIKAWGGAIDVITSFDVIEHVEHPGQFMQDVYALLKEGGSAIIGTPTEAPAMRQLLGGDFERKQLFSTQHLWVFGEKSLKMLAAREGFQDIGIRYFQRYGFQNFVGWLKEKKPGPGVAAGWMGGALDAVWRREMERNKLADYIVIYLKK